MKRSCSVYVSSYAGNSSPMGAPLIDVSRNCARAAAFSASLRRSSAFCCKAVIFSRAPTKDCCPRAFVAKDDSNAPSNSCILAISSCSREVWTVDERRKFCDANSSFRFFNDSNAFSKSFIF